VRSTIAPLSFVAATPLLAQAPRGTNSADIQRQVINVLTTAQTDAQRSRIFLQILHDRGILEAA
jgi:hypothetical protein